MADFFINSTTWVVDFRYDGKPRRWFKIFRDGLDPAQHVREELRTLYGDRAWVEQVRMATAEEESQFMRGEETRNVYCPTGRGSRSK